MANFGDFAYSRAVFTAVDADSGSGRSQCNCNTMSVMTIRTKVPISQHWLIAGLVLLLACAAAIVWLPKWSAPFKQQPGAELGLVHRTPEGLALGRSQAFQAMAAGRFDQAYAFYRLVPEADWRAEDCFNLGLALEQRKRLVLALASFVAARRIDPGHTASIRSLDALQGAVGFGNRKRTIRVS